VLFVPILENIQLLCKKHNISVPKLEREIGLGNGAIYKWDKSSPTSDKLQKVAEYFKVPTDYLVYGFNRGWLAAGLTIIKNGRTFSQFTKDTDIDEDILHELCAGTATKQPSLEIVEKINASKYANIPPRNDILEAAGYDPIEVTLFPKLHLRIKELREKEKLTIEELSELTEVESNLLKLYELGEKDNNPNPDVLAQIADYFDCTPDYLLGLANKSYRDRYKSLFNDETQNFITQIDEIIANIDPDKYKKQRHEKFIAGISDINNDNSLPSLTPKDERVIARDLEAMLSDLDSKNGMAAYNEPEDEEDRELLKASLLTSMRLAKQIAKKKFTPKKYRKE
jgi:transcriptional regulator with XRE-family HTH domain